MTLHPCPLCGARKDEPCTSLGGNLYHHEGDRVLLDGSLYTKKREARVKLYSVWLHRPSGQETKVSDHATLAAAVKKARADAPCEGIFADPDACVGETRVRSLLGIGELLLHHRFRRVPVEIDRGRGLAMKVFEVDDQGRRKKKP